MKQTFVTYISPKQCPYSVDGKNLTEFRRAQLRKVAQAVKVDAEGSKNALLQRIISKLNLIDAPRELSVEVPTADA